MRALVIAGAVVILGVLGYFLLIRKTEAPETAMEAETPAMTEQKGGMMGVTDWIAAAARGSKLECEYAMPGAAEGQTMKMQIEGKKYRSEFQAGDATMVSVFDGETTWSWDPARKTGFKMAMSCLEDFQKSMPQGEKGSYYGSSEEAIGNTPNISCREAGAVDLSVPADVNFTDQCAMLQQSAKMMEQYKDQVPEQYRGMMGQ